MDMLCISETGHETNIKVDLFHNTMHYDDLLSTMSVSSRRRMVGDSTPVIRSILSIFQKDDWLQKMCV